MFYSGCKTKEKKTEGVVWSAMYLTVFICELVELITNLFCLIVCISIKFMCSLLIAKNNV